MEDTSEKISMFIINYEGILNLLTTSSHRHKLGDQDFVDLTFCMRTASDQIINHLTRSEVGGARGAKFHVERTTESESESTATILLTTFKEFLSPSGELTSADKDRFPLTEVQSLFTAYKASEIALKTNTGPSGEGIKELLGYMKLASDRIITELNTSRSRFIEKRKQKTPWLSAPAMTGGAGGGTASAAGPAGAGSAGRAEPLRPSTGVTVITKPPSRIDNALQKLDLYYPDVPGLMPTFFTTKKWTFNELKLLATINKSFYTELASVFQKIQKDSDVKDHDMLKPDVLLRMFFPADYLGKYDPTSEIGRNLQGQIFGRDSTALQKHIWAWNDSFRLLKAPRTGYDFLEWKEIQAAWDEIQAAEALAAAYREAPAPSPLHDPDPSYGRDSVEAPFRRESVDDPLLDGPSPMREAALGRAPSPLTPFERLLNAVLHREITHYTAEIHDLFHEANVAYSRGIKEEIFNDGYNKDTRARELPKVNTSARPDEDIPLCPTLFREYAQTVLNRLKCELQGR